MSAGPEANSPASQPEPPPQFGLGALVSLAAFLACVLLALDLLLGGLTVGAYLDAPPTGPPLPLVDLLGLVVYFALLVLPAMAVYAVGRRRAQGPQPPSLWFVAFGIPLGAIAVLIVALGVGGGVPGGAGKRALTALLVAAIGLLILLLGRLRSAAAAHPGRLVGFGLLLALTAWSGLQAAAPYDFGLVITRKVRVVQVELVVLWTGVFSLAVLLHARGRPGLRLGSARRLAIGGLIFCALPIAVRVGHAIARPAPRGGNGPSVVLVIFDAMRADRLSLYGGRVPTPQFEALAAQGIAFEQARSQAPHTTPSMMSLFSSRYPGELVKREGDASGYTIPQASESLAEALRAKGYATCAISANRLLDTYTGIMQGFSERVVLNHHLRRRNVFSQALPGLEAMLHWAAPRPEHACLMDTSQVMLRYLKRFLERQSGSPCFVWLHFMDPHDPYAPPAPYRDALVRGKGPWPVFAPHDPLVGTPTDAEIRAGVARLDPARRQYVSDLYDAEIAYADALLGEVRAMVERAVGKRPVIWCVAADHGEEFWDHGSYYHGHSLYEELIHVPLVIAASGADRGLRVSEPVALIDVMPTLFELCALTVPRGSRGRSLAGRVAGGRPLAPAPTFSHANSYYEPAETVISGGYKLVRHRESKRIELYDLARDPGERNNLADAPQERGAELTWRLLAVHLNEWRASLRPARGRRSDKIRQEQIDRLKSLGYM